MIPTFDDEVRLAKEQFMTFRLRPGGVLNMARLTTEDGDIVVALDLDNADQRRAVLTHVVREYRATKVVWFSDAWFKMLKQGEVQDREVRDYPDKTQALVVTMVTADEEHFASFPYEVIDNQIVWGELPLDLQQGKTRGLHTAVREAIREVRGR